MLANKNVLAAKALVMFPNARKFFSAVFTSEWNWVI
jgi:hypothetical protein